MAGWPDFEQESILYWTDRTKKFPILAMSGIQPEEEWTLTIGLVAYPDHKRSFCGNDRFVHRKISERLSE